MKKIILLLSFSFIFLSSYSQDSQIKALKTLLKKDAFKTILVGDSLINNGNLNNYEIAKVKYYQALAYQNNKNYKKAIRFFNEILPILEKNDNKDTYVSAILSQSNANVYLNNYTIATTQALTAKKLAIKYNITDLVASSNSALSFIYYSNQDYLKALEYLLSSEKILIKENKTEELSAVYNNMAILYKKMGQFNKAILYNNKSLQISIDENHFLGIGKSYSNIGRIHAIQGNLNKAITFYNKAIEVNLKNNISNSVPYENIGEAYSKMNQVKQAENYFKKALNIELNNQNNSKIKNLYTILLEIFIKNKDFEKAYKYQQKIEAITKTIVKHDNDEKIRMIENQYLLSKKQQELINTKRTSKNQFLFFIALTFLLLFLGLFIIQRNKNNKLKIQKEKIMLEQRVLRSQMNPHFIFNALSAIQNSLLDNEPIKSASYLSRFAKLIRQNFDFINEKTILLCDEIDALKNYLDTQKMRFQNKFDYEINIFADVDINSIEIPPILLQPFIENAIEHGFKNKKETGLITINISKKNNFICYEIKDNGHGIATKNKTNKLHAIDVFKKRLKLIGNNDEKSFKIISSNKGTTIKFCLKND